jgi:hypothetical protein
MLELVVGTIGRITSIAVHASQGVALTNVEKPITEILEEMVDGAAAILSRVARE